mmetsp:Transcript_7710/g.12934  ORF Transcript_7710/g.12934 Transcript_7710/m.12934 type:complete len:296 (+) Transcript_7710:242-1129(+)
MLNAIFCFLKEFSYSEPLVKWYHSIIFNVFMNSQKQENAVVGIPLQICDVIVEEMNKVDPDAPLEVICAILQPILDSLGLLISGELKERVIEKIFTPLMENNKTEVDGSSTDEEEMEKREKYHRLVDGGKMHPRTQREIEKMLKRKYIFPCFNNLIYAQNYILKLASETDTSKVKEENREALYNLYEFAHQLEPKPSKEDLTFSQIQLINKANSFVTMKMKKRENIRKQKQDAKEILKMKKIAQSQMVQKQAEINKEINESADDSAANAPAADSKKAEESKTKAIHDKKPASPVK